MSTAKEWPERENRSLSLPLCVPCTFDKEQYLLIYFFFTVFSPRACPLFDTGQQA